MSTHDELLRLASMDLSDMGRDTLEAVAGISTPTREAAKPLRTAATIRQGWKRPSDPLCPTCGDRTYATVYNTGDGWTWGYDCASCGPDALWWDDETRGAGEPYDWPFVEVSASPQDWDDAGIVVV